MTEYLMMLLGASLIVAAVTILAPDGGLSRSMRLLTSLFLVAILLSPLLTVIERLSEYSNGEILLPWEEEASPSPFEDQLQGTLDSASKQYFTEALTRHLENEFSMKTGNVRCEVLWTETDNGILPSKITVLLSGQGIWKDTAAIEKHVQTLLGCSCVTALE